MKNRILETIKSVGHFEEDFVIGDGAYCSSEIHYNAKPSRYNSQKKYAIQYCDEWTDREAVIAIWEIEKRIKNRWSTDLYSWRDQMRWNEIHELQIGQRRIQGTEEYTEVAVMPFSQLEGYLESLSPSEDEYYRNRLEGNKYEIFSTRYERDPQKREEAIKIHGTRCMVCGFSFEETYGKLGKDYIEVHHIRPISTGTRNTDPAKDLVCLCSNCHRMIHRKKDKVLRIEELKELIVGKNNAQIPHSNR